MKKILILSLLFISGWMSAQAVDRNKENRDPECKVYCTDHKKIVDKLNGLTDENSRRCSQCHSQSLLPN